MKLVIIVGSLLITSCSVPKPTPQTLSPYEVDDWRGGMQVAKPEPGVTCYIIVSPNGTRAMSCLRDIK